MSNNFKDLTVKQLKEICQNEPQKYRGFSGLKKNDLINFMYRKNSTSERSVHKNHEVICDLSTMFETSDDYEERIESLHQEKPEDSIIEDLMIGLKDEYPISNVIFDKHHDPNNDMIYRGNKGKYISLYDTLGEQGEQILFHGTDGNNLTSILSDDFRLTTKPIHGALLGKGIYFTNDIEKAIYYSERGRGTKYVIVCIVHVGDICLGNLNMDIHPGMGNKDKDKTYDTSVDNLRNPKQFVKKKNGTYNILGIITIENYIEKITNNKSRGYNSSFSIRNTQCNSMRLYWVPDKYTHLLPNINLTLCRRLSIIAACERLSDGSIRRWVTSKTQLCQIGHTFICVMHYENGDWPRANAIIRIFKSQRHGEMIVI